MGTKEQYKGKKNANNTERAWKASIDLEEIPQEGMIYNLGGEVGQEL